MKVDQQKPMGREIPQRIAVWEPCFIYSSWYHISDSTMVAVFNAFTCNLVLNETATRECSNSDYSGENADKTTFCQLVANDIP